MNAPTEPSRDTLPSPWLDLTVRLALIAGLVAWSVQIIRPFFSPLIWGAVLAVTVHPLYERVSYVLGGRNKSVAISFVILPLLLFAAPIIVIAE
jgi:predicted PurR-regulated permease PerM